MREHHKHNTTPVGAGVSMGNPTLEQIRLDGGTQVRAQIDLFTVEDYADAMLAGANFPAIIAYYDGTDYWLADGFHRIEAAKRANVDIAVDVRAGTVRDAKLHAVGANASHGLRRTNEDKRRAVLMLLNDDEWRRWSDNQIAKRCGVSVTFIGKLRTSLSTVDSDATERVYVDRYGNERVMNTGNIGGATRETSPDMFAAPQPQLDIGDEEDNHADDDAPLDFHDWATPDDIYRAGKAALLEQYQQEVAEHYGEVNAELREEEKPDGDELVARKPHVAHNSGDNEWYTPSEYLDAARRVMGAIDLDPASSEIANERVRATVYYTAQDNGLDFAWSGRVWMNPPYASDLIGKFCEKLAQHHENGSVPEAIVLVNNATETQWFQRLAHLATSIAFPKGRVRFLDPAGNPGAPLQGQAVVYLGPNSEQFAAEFSTFGFVR
jgi:phage N-6-adenine-methyltransferase